MTTQAIGTAMTGITAMSGNAGAAGNYDAATAAGLLVARDGIVGQWKGATLDPGQRDLNSAANLEDWSQMIRVQTILQDLMSNTGLALEDAADEPQTAFFHFSRNDPASPGNETFSITARRIASFIRPDATAFERQLDEVRNYADLRGDRLPEILTQAGHPTPYLISIADLHPGRRQYTHELLSITQVFATQIVLGIKHALGCHRPDAFSPQVQPVIPTPGHGTLPSGHATEAFAMAVVLGSGPINLLEAPRAA